MNTAYVKQNSPCFHCGESCDGSLVADSHVFCCDGCKTVYELLSENNLTEFYKLNSQPGVTLKNNAGKKQYSYLDNEFVRSKLIQFDSDGLSTVSFYIPKIHCNSCIYLLENIYRLNNAVLRSQVRFNKREVKIAFNPQQISLKELVQFLDSIGYQPQINLDDLNHKNTNPLTQQYYLKIGVAFFAFGNIMLLSFPEYLGLDVLVESPFRSFFGYLNFLLALPVMFYCASEFFNSAWNAAKQRVLNMDVPITLGILAMFARSTYEILSHTGAGYFDTLSSLVLLMLIGRLFQNKTYDTLSFDRDYQSYFPVAVNKTTNGFEEQIPLTKLQVNDSIIVRNMELIPADAILVSPIANIDYSFVTGEATPVIKRSGDTIYAGGKQLGSAVQLKVIKDVSHSYLTELWNDAVFDKTTKENITSLATKMSNWFTPIVIFIAATCMLFWWNTDVNRALNAFTSILIITCPCALALSSPFTLGNVLRLLGAKKIYLKNALTIEKLSRINTIVFDKTGTLTNTKEGKISYVSTINDEKASTLSEYDLQLVKSLVYHSSHPLSKKVNELLRGIKVLPTNEFKETEGLGIEGVIDNHRVKIGSKKFLCGDNYPGVSTESDFRHASKVYVSIDSEVRGFFLVKNEYRKHFKELMNRLNISYQVYIVSGDNDAEKIFLKQFVQEDHLVFHQQPVDKLKFVKALKAEKKNVMMVGDGLNDAGALKQADVGISITDDVNNFSPACDGILIADQFKHLCTLLKISQSSMTIIKISFLISLLYNCVGIYFATQGTMSPITAAVLMPISSVTIILFTTLASTFIVKQHQL